MSQTTDISSAQIGVDLAVGRNVIAGGDARIRGNAIVGHDLEVQGWLKARNIIGPCRGYFKTADALEAAYPSPRAGWWAMVGDAFPATIYRVEGGEWTATDLTTTGITVENADLTQLQNAVAQLQALVTVGIVDPASVKFTTTADSGTFAFTAYETNDAGVTVPAQHSVSVPIATTTQAGLMAAADKQAIADNKQAIADNKQAIAAETTARAAADAQLQKNIDAEATARADAATNLLQRLKGRAANSNGYTDPFIYGGTFTGNNAFSLMLAAIGSDPLQDEDNYAKYAGRVRYDINGVIFDVQNYPIHYATGEWLQVISGGLAIADDGTLSSDKDLYGTYYRSHADDAWTAWQQVAAIDDTARTAAQTANKAATTAKLMATALQAVATAEHDGLLSKEDKVRLDALVKGTAYDLPIASANQLGGVRAEPGTFEDDDICVKIVSETGKLFISGGNVSGAIQIV